VVGVRLVRNFTNVATGNDFRFLVSLRMNNWMKILCFYTQFFIPTLRAESAE
jgi:hypothetical protein